MSCLFTLHFWAILERFILRYDMAGFAVAVAVFSWSMANLALSSDLVALLPMLRMAERVRSRQGKQVCFQVRTSASI